MGKVLHIANDYAGSTVYMNLARELDKLGVEQIIYTPVRGAKTVGNNAIEFLCEGSNIIYSSLLNWHIDRLFYPYKAFKIISDIQRKVDFAEVDFIHAHTWYSDGGVAYLLAKKYNIPFSVTIRNTDLNLFQKKIVYLRTFGRTILEQAKSIFLISSSYLPRVLSQKSLQVSLDSIQEKIEILPNGVDCFWLQNTVEQKKIVNFKRNFNLIYVGRLTSGKNVSVVQKAVVRLNRDTHFLVHFNIVGGGGNDEEEVLELVKKYPEYFTYHGRVYDKKKLASLYRASDIFAMPSTHETFGLVYVEAMLQGLPILYTENEGIDGFYSDDVGEKVKTPTIQEIREKLIRMMENIDSYNIPIDRLKENHDWAVIAKKYASFYD